MDFATANDGTESGVRERERVASRWLFALQSGMRDLILPSKASSLIEIVVDREENDARGRKTSGRSTVAQSIMENENGAANGRTRGERGERGREEKTPFSLSFFPLCHSASSHIFFPQSTPTATDLWLCACTATVNTQTVSESMGFETVPGFSSFPFGEEVNSPLLSKKCRRCAWIRLRSLTDDVRRSCATNCAWPVSLRSRNTQKRRRGGGGGGTGTQEADLRPALANQNSVRPDRVITSATIAASPTYCRTCGDKYSAPAKSPERSPSEGSSSTAAAAGFLSNGPTDVAYFPFFRRIKARREGGREGEVR